MLNICLYRPNYIFKKKQILAKYNFSVGCNFFSRLSIAMLSHFPILPDEDVLLDVSVSITHVTGNKNIIKTNEPYFLTRLYIAWQYTVYCGRVIGVVQLCPTVCRPSAGY